LLNNEGERPAEIHKQIIAVCGNVLNRQNVTKWCREFLGKFFHVDYEVNNSCRGSKGKRNRGIQKLVPRLNKCLDKAGDYVEI
jgi:hypothetical protein